MSESGELPLITDDRVGLPPLDPSARVAPSPLSVGPRHPPPGVRRAAPGSSVELLRAWLLTNLFSPAFRPLIATEFAWQFADEKRVKLEHGGVYQSRRRPHCRRFQEAFTDPRIREQHIMKASRSGFTEAALNRVRQMADSAPGNVQFCAGSKKNSEELNNARLVPTLNDLGVTGGDSDVDPDDVTSSIIRLATMSIRISGAYTAGSFRTNAIKFFVNDDCELVTDIPGIGSPADGARSRIRGIEGAQLASISRPTDYGTPHHRDTASGTLEFFAVPCPHCGTVQELTIDGTSLVDQLRIEEDPTGRGGPPLNAPLTDLRGAPLPRPRLGRLRFDHCKMLPGVEGESNPGGWDFDRITVETYYECVGGTRCDDQGNVIHCQIRESTPLTDADLANPLSSFSDEVRALHADGYRLSHKQAMMLSGRHLISNPRPVPADGGGPRSKRSEHNSDLTSLDFDMTWGHFAKKLAERAHDPALLRNFLNEHAGLPWRDRKTVVTDRDLIECRSPYARCTIPFRPDFLTVCADTQDNFWKFVVAAGRLDSAGKAWRDIAVLNWGVAVLKADLLAELQGWFDAQTKQRRPYELSSNPAESFLPINGLVDSGGHRTDEVYELFYDSGGAFFPSKGSDQTSLQQRMTWQRPMANGWRGCNFDICWYWDDFWQRKLVSSIQQVRDIKRCTEVEKLDPAAKGLPPRLWIPGMPADASLRDFEKELLNEVLIEGEWTKLGPQDYRDALKECLASFDLALPTAVMKRAAREKSAAEAAAKK
jgi:hypothetical protein